MRFENIKKQKFWQEKKKNKEKKREEKTYTKVEKKKEAYMNKYYFLIFEWGHVPSH